MSFRSVILGLLRAVAICVGGYFYDHIIKQGYLVPHQMPTVIYGGLIVFVVCINPALQAVRRQWRLSGPELAVIIGMGLVACSIPSWGLVQGMIPMMVMPHHHAGQSVLLQRAKIIDATPPQMLVDPVGDKHHVVNGYVAGLSEGGEHIPIGRVPWGAWQRTLSFWVPLVVAMLLATLGLAVVLHHQWARREHVSYPISKFAHALLPDKGHATPAVLRAPSFWAATIGVAAVSLTRFANTHWPRICFIRIDNALDFSGLRAFFPHIISGGGDYLFKPAIFFAIIGLAYFLPSTVSFSCGVVAILYCLIAGLLTEVGVELLAGQHLTGNLNVFVYTGGYFGILLMLLYTGRRYYWTTLRQSLCVPVAGKIEPVSAWGMRLFLVGTIAFVVQLRIVGLPVLLAVLYTGIMLMIYIVVSRVIAETGMFHIGTELMPEAVIGGFLGGAVIGFKGVLIMGMVSGVLLLAPGWATMPFAVQGLRLADLSRVRLGRLSAWGPAVVLIGLAVAVPMTLYWQYNRGAGNMRDWPVFASVYPPTHAANVKTDLDQARRFGGTSEGRGLLGAISPDGPRVTAFTIAAALAVAIGLCNLRFPWWPLHPVMFVFLGGFQGKLIWFSCMIGWAAKQAVLKFGGGKYYESFKPMMIGLIAGEVISHLVPMVVGTIHFLVTGRPLN